MTESGTGKKLMTKTPDEIKKGLSICRGAEISCRECPYDCSPNSCDGSPEEDAIEYINQLEERNEKLENVLRNLANSSSNARDAANKVIEHLKSRLAQVERERDAAVRIVHGLCLHCKNEDSKYETCRECMYYPYRFVYSTGDTYVDNWVWRGVCEENTKEE